MSGPAAIRAAQAALRDGDVTGGEVILAAAVREAPNDAVLRAAYGELLFVTGAHAAAAVQFEAALALAPAAHAVRRRFIDVALIGGRLDDAEAAARRLAADLPTGDSLRLLADILVGQDRLEDALGASEQALALDPQDPNTLHAHAVLLAKLGRSDEALEVYDSLVAIGATGPSLWFNRHVVLVNLGRLAQAEAELAEATRTWEADALLQSALASVRWMLGAGSSFADECKRAVARSGNADLTLACADVLRKAGQAEEAENMLRAAAARAPDDAALLTSLGLILDELERTDEALPFLQKAVSLAPHVSGVRGNAAAALLRLGRGDEAMREIEILRRLEPHNQEWICYEAMALRQTNDPRHSDLCDYESMVQVYELEPPRGFSSLADFNAALAARLRSLQTLNAHPLDQSLRNGSQTTRNLIHLKDPLIQAYFVALDAPVQAYLSRMRAPGHPWSGRNTGRYRIAGCWSVLLRAGGHHVSHFHPAGWISSAYYVALPPGMSDDETHQGWLKFGEPRWSVPGCGVERLVAPKEGRIVLFPSYMWHGTIPFAHGERLTAPFDVVPG